jgi:hypothetical protein
MAYGKWFFHSSTDGRVHAVDLFTGKQAWQSEPNIWPWGGFGSYVASAGYGNYYQGTWDGYLSCYDAATGATKWRTFLGNNSDTTMGHNVPWGCPAIADGKIFQVSSEHTPPNPFPRGNQLYAIDAFNGTIYWNVPFMNGYSSATLQGFGVSAGILFAFNMYDGKLYNFGIGKSATTVSAPTTTVPSGTGVLIQGTVTDQSPGAPGTPAVSDDSQPQWMQYLYQNKPMPTNVNGVPVFLQAMLSNGTLIDIWHVKTDLMGHYEYTWVPPTQDTYKIIATFEGSNSYYTSSGECGLSVGSAAPNVPSANDIANQVVSQLPTAAPVVTASPYPTLPPTLNNFDPVNIYLAIAAVAVILIVVMAVVAIVILRKIK